MMSVALDVACPSTIQRVRSVGPDTPDLAGWSVTTLTDAFTYIFGIAGATELAVAWGDGEEDVYTDGGPTYIEHEYALAGTYEIRIVSGTASLLQIAGGSSTGDRVVSVDIPFSADLGLTSAYYMFAGCNNITSWCPAFFDAASSGITKFGNMFSYLSSFNEDISAWDMSSAQYTDYMFAYTDFDRDVSTWGISGDLVSARGMFLDAPFDRDLSSWVVDGVTNFVDFLSGSNFSQINYDLLLPAWAAQGLQSGVTAHFGSARYGAGAPAAARGVLTGTYSWIVTDGGAA